jgi:hypothetical protein
LVDFLEDVEEQLRSERFLGRVRQAIPWIVGALALVLLAYLAFWAFKAFQDRNLASAASAYQNGLYALGKGDQAAALADFEAARKAGAPGYATLASMQQGDVALANGKAEEAARDFDQAAATAPNRIFGDLASLKAAEAALDTEPLAQIRTRLTPLTEAGRPFALYAKEALAFAELKAGHTDEARRDLTVLQLSLGAPQDVRQRAELATAAIDQGEAGAASAGASVAATMPPSPPTMLAPPSAPASQSAPAPTPSGAAQ